MAWPQPALENVSIQAVWDGNPDHPADLHIGIEFTSIPSSKLRLIQFDHPKVKNVKTSSVKRLPLRTSPQAAPRSTINRSCHSDDPLVFNQIPRRMLFTPPSHLLVKHEEDQDSEASTNDSESNRDTPKAPAQRQQQLQVSRSRPSSGTPSGTKLVRYARDESTDSTTEISLPATSSESDSPINPSDMYQKASAPHQSRHTMVFKPSRQTFTDSRIPVLPHRKPPQFWRRKEYAAEKPSWRVPAAGDSIFPRGRKSIMNTTIPRRVSRSADARMIQDMTGKKVKQRARLRSSSFGAPGHRDLTVQVHPGKSIADWLQNARTSWWSSEESADPPALSLVDSASSIKQHGVESGPIIKLHQNRPSPHIQPPSLPSTQANETPREYPMISKRHAHLRGGSFPLTSPLLDDLTESGVAPMIQDVERSKWAVCLPNIEEEVWSVELEAQICLERHPQGGHTLSVPGLPHQAGNAEGNYSIKLQDLECSNSSLNDTSVHDKVQIVDDPGTLRVLRNGKDNGTFAISEDFSLRFLSLEHNRWLGAEDFDVEYAIEESHEIGDDRGLVIFYGLICVIHPGQFMWWAEQVTFTLYIRGSPWNRTTFLPVAGDSALNMGMALRNDLDNECAITFTKHVAELSKPIKMIWKQHCGSQFTRLAPGVSNRPQNVDLAERCRQLRSSATFLIEQAHHDTNTANQDGFHEALFPHSLSPLTVHKAAGTAAYKPSPCNKALKESGERPWLYITAVVCALLLLVAAVIHPGIGGSTKLNATVRAYRLKVTNASFIRNLPEKWERDPWEIYLREEWGVQMVDIKDDRTGWKALMNIIKDDVTEEERTGAVEIEEIEIGPPKEENETIQVEHETVSVDTEVESEEPTADHPEATLEVDHYVVDEERGTLGKMRDAVDYALGWRPLD